MESANGRTIERYVRETVLFAKSGDAKLSEIAGCIDEIETLTRSPRFAQTPLLLVLGAAARALRITHQMRVQRDLRLKAGQLKTAEDPSAIYEQMVDLAGLISDVEKRRFAIEKIACAKRRNAMKKVRA